MKHGWYTAELGRRLNKRVQASSWADLRVYFDHGEKDMSKRTVPYFGEYGTSTTLAFVDIAVVNEQSGKVLVLCEVEEEGANPKKVIGDCLNIFLSDYVSIGRKRYNPRGAHFILGARVDEKGNSKDKISKLEHRIPNIIRKDALKGMRLKFIPVSDPDRLLDRLEDRICRIIGIRN